MRRISALFSILFLLSGIGYSQVPFTLGGASNIQLTLKSDNPTAAPGDTVNLVLKMDHAPGWNTYWVNPGTGMPTTLTWTLPDGFKTGKTIWPIPKLKNTDLGTNHIYIDQTYVVTPLEIPENAVPGDIEIKLQADWLECDIKGCIPKGGDASLKLKIAETAVADPEVKSFVKKVTTQQARELDSWKVEISGSPAVFEAKLTPGMGANPDPGEIYFFESTASPGLKYEMPEISRSGDSWIFKMAKSDEIPSSKIEGFFYAPNGWETTDPKVKSLATSSGAGKVATSTQGPEYVTLDGKAEKKLTVWNALVFAFLGGLILNLMPCVFPVLGLKIMGFVQQAGDHPKRTKIHGLVFAAGLILTLWILAAIVIILGKGWGFQLSSPGFLIFIILLLFVMSLNLFGVFEIGTSLMGVGGNLEHKKGYSGSFWSGVLTTIIATPCSGPFLGPAMGFTLSQPAAIAFLIFTSLAFGIASPYVVLAFNPRLISKLPKPGPWMDTFKKVLAFPLLAAVLFFMNSLAAQKGREGLVWVLLAMLIAAAAAWVYGNWGNLMRPRKTRIVSWLVTLIMLGSTFVFSKKASKVHSEVDGLKEQITTLEDQLKESIANGGKLQSSVDEKPDGIEWIKWSPERIRDLRSEGRAIFVDYTASW